MKEENFRALTRTGILRQRQIDTPKIKSALESAIINVTVAKKIPLDENSATVIFTTIYESIRQLGNILWWMRGYEPQNHDVSLEILKDLEIKNKIKLNHLDRFRQIRHDANYRGFRVLASQAKEIIDFWRDCCEDIINFLQKDF